VNELADRRQIAGLQAGLEIPARDYLRAMRMRRRMHQELRRLFANVDLLVTPAFLSVAPKVSERLDREPDRTRPKDAGLTQMIPAGNLAGFPSLCLPCGFADNLPVSIQFVSVPFSENRLIAIGKEYQARTDWHRRHPAV
jgi:Asp-tRNA(Asn)/Glu-tRNA(Gln) amidotransferase A subunit family amidase